MQVNEYRNPFQNSENLFFLWSSQHPLWLLSTAPIPPRAKKRIMSIETRSAHLEAIKKVLQPFVTRTVLNPDEFKEATKRAVQGKFTYPIPRLEATLNVLKILLESVLPADSPGREEVQLELNALQGTPATDGTASGGAAEEENPLEALAQVHGRWVRPFSIAELKEYMAKRKEELKKKAKEAEAAAPTFSTLLPLGGLTKPSSTTGAPSHYMVLVQGLQEMFGEAASGAAKAAKDAILEALRGVGLTVATPLSTSKAAQADADSQSSESLFSGVAVVRCSTKPRADTAVERILGHRWGVGIKPVCEVLPCANDKAFQDAVDRLSAEAAARLLSQRNNLKTVAAAASHEEAHRRTAAASGPTPQQARGSGSDDIYGDLADGTARGSVPHLTAQDLFLLHGGNAGMGIQAPLLPAPQPASVFGNSNAMLGSLMGAPPGGMGHGAAPGNPPAALVGGFVPLGLPVLNAPVLPLPPADGASLASRKRERE
jgi:hypothetical protein